MRTYQEQAHAYYMRLPAYGAVVELVLSTRSFSLYTLCWRDVTRSVVGRSDVQILYGLMCLAAARVQGDQPKVAFDFAIVRRLTHRTKFC
jgi:hypothetical protein